MNIKKNDSFFKDNNVLEESKSTIKTSETFGNTKSENKNTFSSNKVSILESFKKEQDRLKKLQKYNNVGKGLKNKVNFSDTTDIFVEDFTFVKKINSND